MYMRMFIIGIRVWSPRDIPLPEITPYSRIASQVGTSCIFPNIHIFKIDRMMSFCNLFMERPSCVIAQPFITDVLNVGNAITASWWS